MTKMEEDNVNYYVLKISPQLGKTSDPMRQPPLNKQVIMTISKSDVHAKEAIKSFNFVNAKTSKERFKTVKLGKSQSDGQPIFVIMPAKVELPEGAELINFGIGIGTRNALGSRFYVNEGIRV